LADLVLGDLARLKQSGVDEPEQRSQLEALFRLSNSLFLRLNSPPRDTVRFMLSNAEIIPQVIALCKCFISIQAGYRVNDSLKFEDLDSETLNSFVEQALMKAKAMFPTKTKTIK
jgi:hypothetical protein